MRVMFLGPADSLILGHLKAVEKDLVATAEPVRLSSLKKQDICFLVSHGYRHIITADIIQAFAGRIINLHIAYLPWNRGADPNFWSFIDDTPKGVTIHFMDKGIDTGDIIAQKEVSFPDTVTLRESYDILQKEILALFKEYWPRIRAGVYQGKKQNGEGTFHLSKDRAKFEHLLTKGWDTPVSVLEEYAQQNKKHSR